MKIALATLLILITFSATAEIYKWTDKHGVVHYEDKQPDNTDKVPPANVETVALKPVKNLGAAEKKEANENQSLFTQWLEKALTLKTELLRRIEEWRGSSSIGSISPVVSNQDNSVEIYTTSWCGICKKAKAWLKERGIAYKEYDVEKDAAAAERMRKLGGGGTVPFAVINEKTVNGFNPASYQAALH